MATASINNATVPATSAPLDAADTRRKLLRLAAPVYFELVSGVVAGVIDTLWVGRLGEAAIGAVAIATTVENVLLGVILMVNIGTTVLISSSIGRNETSGLRTVMRAVGVLWMVITPVIAIGGFLAREQVAGLFTSGGDIFRLTVEFFAISFPGMAVFFAQNVIDGIFKGTGDTRTPMRMAILANALILVLDPLLIYGLAGLPRMGVAGAALAMLIGRAVALATALVLLRRKRRAVLGAATGGGELTLRQALSRILGVGLPASADFVIRMAAGMTLVVVVAGFGASPLAAYGIGIKILVFITMALYAVRQAASIHLARSAALSATAARDIGRQSLFLAGGIALGAGLPAALGGGLLVQAFTGDAAVIHEGTILFWFFIPYLAAIAGTVTLGGVFAAGGHARSMLWVALLGAAVQLPLAFGLGAVPALGINGVWTAMVLGAGAQYALSYGLFRRYCPAEPALGGRLSTTPSPAGTATPTRSA